MKKKYKEEFQEIVNQLIESKITISEFEMQRELINKKFEIFIQEKYIKGLRFSCGFSMLGILFCGFICILSILIGNIVPFITNGLLVIFNSINLIVNLKILKKSKIKLVKSCLI